jgi:hypothetical protein
MLSVVTPFLYIEGYLLFCTSSYLNGEVNCTDPTSLVSVHEEPLLYPGYHLLQL